LGNIEEGNKRQSLHQQLCKIIRSSKKKSQGVGKCKRQKIKKITLWVLAIASTCIHSEVKAQRNTQVWFDFAVDYPFANQYMFEVETSYQTVLASDSAWHSFGLTPQLEYNALQRVDFSVSTPLSYTVQTTNYNTFESRITLESRIHITQNKRVNTRVVFKGDKRYLYDVMESTWEHSTRLRVKGEATISINGPNLYQDRLWYAIVDYEEYFVVDEQLDERYANRRRARLGAGYRLSYRDRFELIYTLQSSRNEIQGDFLSTDSVIQLRYKMFLNPAKPTAPTK